MDVSTALFLRPFWQPDHTVRQLLTIARLVRPFGTLTAIRNGDEGRQGFAGWRLRRLGVELVDATDDTWQEHALDHIRRSNVVMVHVAPRTNADLDTPFAPDGVAHQGDDDLLKERVHESASGRGVLLELDYCRRANAGHKLIALVPRRFERRLAEVLRIVAMQQAGTWFSRRADGLEALTPRMSALDESLGMLNEAKFVIVYDRFGDMAFRLRLFTALSLLMNAHTTPSAPEVFSGIPPRPIALPPDEELKHIRFTPVQNLVKLPRGKIVELSFAEVLVLYPEVADEPLECPRCSRNREQMFWYQYGLEPDLTRTAGVHMKCQYCGHSDYLR